MKKYIVFYSGNCYAFIEAKDIKDLIIEFADYTEDKTDLFLKSLQGCDTSEDYIKMYEHFGKYHIDNIFLSEIIYDANKGLKTL